MTDRAAAFEEQRSRLYGIAYRMLGSRDDAQDIVQEAYLRWHETDVGSVRSPQAWLTTTTTRLCIDRLRAAQAWTESVTLVGETHVPDAVFAETRAFFDEQELVDLTLAIVAINGWNRLSVALRAVPGTYQPAKKAA